MRYTRGFTVVEALVLVVVVGLLTGGGFVWYQHTKMGQVSQQVTVAPTLLPEQASEAASLATYRDEELGISFEYPKGWTVHVQRDNTGILWLRLQDKQGHEVMNFNNFGYPLDCGPGGDTPEEVASYDADLAARTHSFPVTIGTIPVVMTNPCGFGYYWKDMQSSKGYVAVDVSKAVDLDRGVVKAEYAKPLDELLRSVRGLSLQN